jgi:hypothetical protein
MFKKVLFFFIVLLTVVVATILPRTAYGYEWTPLEKLDIVTPRHYIHLSTSGSGESQTLLPREVESDFFFRVETSDSEVKFRVEIFRLFPEQTFGEVSADFSNGGCPIVATLSDEQSCLRLTPGNYIVKIIVDGPKAETVSTVWGPPIPSK